MEPPEGWDPYGRPARRTQWLVSALAYHYGLDRGVENEIVVLATGLDQYLQEIFHHLDCAGAGRIPGEDFRTLCQVLGLEEAAAAEPEECAGLWDGLSAELTFRQFHARLCGYFSTQAGSAAPRLPLGRESEHIERQIRLRSPRRRRRDPAVPGAAGRPGGGGQAAGRRPAGPCPPECYEEVVALERAEDRIAKLEEENGSLRELVEDMRAALQSSDARCLALQVGLRKSHANHKDEGTCFVGSKRPLTQNNSQTKCLQSVLKEVELIRSSRDGQIEEAIRFNQELERELKSSQEALVSLEDCNRNLKREQAEMRKKVEEARHAVLNSLGKVKELEVKANEVPHLQIYIQQLESELQHYRSEMERCQRPPRSSLEQREGAAPAGGRYPLAVPEDRRPPTGGAGISENEDQLFRSVEGQAASDEEEEKWAGDQPAQVDQMKKRLAKLPCCGSGCDEKMWKKLMSYLETTNTDGYEAAPAELADRITQLTEQLELKGHEVKKLETNMEEMKGPLLGELQQKVEETELLKMELQMLETERVRLSLVEEKLMDVLQLLQQLRDLNVSKRALGKILLSTLESCRDPQPGKAHLFEVLDTLYHELTACEALQSQPLEKAQSCQSLSNPLVISC
ncbi:EF-hand and coiled-coil domain-containing protein 1 isoform X1 [Falco biarmicus]|uniref:EF-hand and coiled-coil domain-containing protein 1 isoform X1 n=1 Tax=Falco rusticolus TaxID=120794 RepID=UPI001886696D|nr:EF-hand and coiled-coil domain-containing protein 1 isoform X1 [Falco rusticolus]XP_055661574.1 EF-hand and coiled-coil domain-containing protein 1 isoform X1 [Falco peregrinus]XP_056192352.1 EF-hand and coiled-coil domain-containing protein 1 isoform X1 [Falco biarmicus]